MNRFAAVLPSRFVRRTLPVAAIGGALASANSAFAAGPDFSTLTTAVDFSTVGTALLAIAALMMVPKVVGWGARKVMGFVRG
ncbi:hypothetical protein [uncultured Pseudacidovorax sp.]|uniref:hypothetical protein n=1 Tax=uncultured Pseudacidovorax sp. TaxID=679313 RepID=UPI0025ED3E06|nr:hypothetical protein [uncultured Pseudacidovorax sp.]